MKGSEARQRYISYALLISLIFLGATCVSILAPFYPAKAASKGVSPSQYGFVFGIFQLIICLSAPVYGRFMAVIGPTFMFKSGVFVTGTCTLLFGFLDKSPPGDTFLGLSFAIRIVWALGESAIFTSTYTMVPRIFPESVATAVSFIESAFGLGAIIGPAVGGVLYELGGFLLPFEVVGAIMLAGVVMTFFALPNISMDEKRNKDSPGVLAALAIPGVSIMLVSVIACSISTGFISVLLEPHLRDFHLEAWAVGLVFMTGAIVYAVMATVFGRFIDKTGRYLSIMIVSMVVSCIAFLLLGPAPFIPVTKSLPLVTVGLACNGFGLAGSVGGSYMGTLDQLTERNFPNDLQTQGLVAGLFNFAFSFGAFIGPSIAGTLYDTIGFANGSLVVLGLLCFMAIVLIIFALTTLKANKSTVQVALVSVKSLNPDVEIFTISNGKLGCALESPSEL